MQVVSNGQYSTLSDCAVGDGEELYIGNDIFVYVTNMSADKLEFEISGIAETTPTPTPTFTPSPTPTATPSQTHTTSPTATPSATPTTSPTATPRPTPTTTPTMTSTATPHPAPTITPTAIPKPTLNPTATPTVSPIASPTTSPTLIPTCTPKPTTRPTAKPTSSPTVTTNPITSPTANPTPDINCNIEGNNLSVTLANSTSGGIILVAEFNSDGRFLRCTTHSPQENISVPLLSTTHTVKVMWWNSLSNLVPITDSKTVTK